MKKFDPTKTVFDLEPPRFDVAGDKITGEWDEIDTPAVEKIRRPIKSYQWLQFWVGLAVGTWVFAIGFMLGLIWR